MTRTRTRYAIVNLAFQLGGDARLLRTVASQADVLLIVEARDRDNRPVPLADLLGPDWRVRQNTSSGETAGTALAVRRRSGVRIAWVRTILASLAGRGVQRRYLKVAHLIDHGTPTRVGVVHLPLAATGRKDDAIRAVTRWWRSGTGDGVRQLLAGDVNMAPSSMVAQLGNGTVSQVGGRDVMAAILGGEWDARIGAYHPAGGTDHAVVTVTAA